MKIKSGVARHKAKKRLFREARGNFGGRRTLLRTVKETIIRSRAYAYRDRKVRKRDMRRLWITRLNAACRMHGMRYSVFIAALAKSEIGLNRKSLSELAMNQPAIFEEVIVAVKKSIA